jgi:hypothetical protein
MQAVTPRRVLLALGVLFVLRKGVQGARDFLVSWVAAKGASAAAAVPPWRLFSAFLSDLRADKVAKVLLASDFVMVQGKPGTDSYKYAIAPALALAEVLY